MNTIFGNQTSTRELLYYTDHKNGITGRVTGKLGEKQIQLAPKFNKQPNFKSKSTNNLKNSLMNEEIPK